MSRKIFIRRLTTPTLTPPADPALLPYPDAPGYRCGDFGGWALKHKSAETFERGYFTGFDVEPPGYYLENQGDVWMSTSRLERESHVVHLRHARGTVVVCGVGMGMYLYNVAALPGVDRVFAVDRDAAVIDLVRRGTGFDGWAGRDKIDFVHKDATELTPDDVGGGRPDFLYVDIWPELGDPAAVSQTRAIRDAIGRGPSGGGARSWISWSGCSSTARRTTRRTWATCTRSWRLRGYGPRTRRPPTSRGAGGRPRSTRRTARYRSP